MSSHEERFNPFPGLRPFEARENHLFFGREGQSHELLRRLRRHRFVAVVGTSGSGKSSLVRAGLLPALHGGLMKKAGSSWRVALFRPGSGPIGNLARALNEPSVFGDDDHKLARRQQTITEVVLRRSDMGLIEATRQARMSSHENLLVVVDQFEELFRFKSAARDLGSRDEAALFVNLLLEATRQQELPIYVMITMRSDFLGDCAQFHDLPEAINDSQYLIPRMTRDQRRQAIVGPVGVGGAQISPRLVQRLLNDVGDNPDQLPIMQHALMRTWDCWQQEAQNGAIDLRHYEQIGGMQRALSQHADEAFAELAAGLPAEKGRRRQEIAEKMFKFLTEMGSDNRETRRPGRLRDIAAVTAASEQEVIEVIDVFRAPGRSFLMPPLPEVPASDTLIDISHESLIRNWQRLRKWVIEENESARVYTRLADTAQLHHEGKAGLYRDPDLRIASDWQQREEPNAIWAKNYHSGFDEAMAFLQQSHESYQAELAAREEQRRKQLRRTQIFSVAMASAFIVSVVLGMWANRQRIAVRERSKIISQQNDKISAKNEQIGRLLKLVLKGRDQYGRIDSVSQIIERLEYDQTAPIADLIHPKAKMTEVPEIRDGQGRQIYDFMIWLDLPSFRRDEIREVRYHIARGASLDRNKIGREPSLGFATSYRGWGCYPLVKITIELTGGTTLERDFNMCEALFGF